MSFYIVCQKKRNNPRMDVRICQKKCELKDECEEFLSFIKSESKDIDTSMPVEPQDMQVGLG